MKTNADQEKMHVHCSAMSRLNSMESRLPFLTVTKLCLLVILLSLSSVQSMKKNVFINELYSRFISNSSSNWKSAQGNISKKMTFDVKTMKELVCDSHWLKTILEINFPQSLLPLSNNDVNSLISDIVTVLGDKYFDSTDFQTEATHEIMIQLLEYFGFWSTYTKFTPDHELYDEIWNSFTWRDPKKGFLTSKDAINFIEQLHLVLQSSRHETELTMLMNFFDQPLNFDNDPTFRSFPTSKTGYTFLSNIELPEQIRILIPRDMSVVKAIEEVQNMIFFNRKELKYNLRLLNVRTLFLQKTNRRCQSLRTTNPSTQKIVCGEPLPKARITGGKMATQGSWPWMAFLLFPSKDFLKFTTCGGTLISDRHVLTTAHCIVSYPIEYMKVYLGEFDRDEMEWSSIQYGVQDIFMHEHYRQARDGSDIALIKLKEKVIFNNDRRPICLPPPDINLDGKTAHIAGWGQRTDTSDTTRKLIEAVSPIWENYFCRKAIQRVIGPYVTEKMLCIGGEGGVNPCQGDSGGPVMYQTTSGQWIVIGLVSFSVVGICKEQGIPTVCTRVSTFLDWINAKLLL